MVQNQATFTVYWLPKKHWRGLPVWTYWFRLHGMWGLAFRILWLGFELHNNSVWSFEDELPRRQRGLP